MKNIILRNAAKYVGLSIKKLKNMAIDGKINFEEKNGKMYFKLEILDKLKRKLDNEKCEQNAVFSRREEIEAKIIERGGTPVAVLAKMIAGNTDEEIIQSCICE